MKTLITTILMAATLATAHAETLIGHEVRLDSHGKLLPWVKDKSPYAHVVELGWNTLKTWPEDWNGLKTYYSYSRYDGFSKENPFRGVWWAHNPAGLAAMLTSGALPYYAYSGDEGVIHNIIRQLLDHHLANGTTSPDDAWASVPYATGMPGEKQYRGGDDTKFCWKSEPCGRGDGVGFIEPDKVGELGHAYLQFHKFTGEQKYLDAALSNANALAKHVRQGDATHSPWPFRVDAKTGTKIREEYTSNVIFAIMLFDDLIKMKQGDVPAYQRARKLAWDWMMEFPMKTGHWQAYFEDIPIFSTPGENLNQYSALETARYLMMHPELDPEWRAHARTLIDFVVRTFAIDWESRHGWERGIQYGAEVISEQFNDMAKMGSHTARYASIQALWYELTGDRDAYERAYRSLNWATYSCDERGIVKVGPNDDEGYWFSDGYGDYMKHFQFAMGSIPEWAPKAENHILRSSSMITHVNYSEKVITYSTYDADSVEVIKTKALPRIVIAGEEALLKDDSRGLESYSVSQLPDGAYRVEIRHRGAQDVRILLL